MARDQEKPTQNIIK